MTYTGVNLTPCGTTASVTGFGGASLGTVPVTYSPSPVILPGNYTANATFAGNDLYNAASAVQQSFSIAKGTPLVTVSCPVAVPFTGADQSPCTAAVTGVGGAPLGTAPVTYAPTTPNASGTYSATASYAGSAIYNAANAIPQTFSIAFNFSDGFETPSAWSTG